MKVSVCIITYNHKRFIAQTIDSVLMQHTDFDYEIVIGEDCSTDSTRDIVKEYASKYPDKIRTLLHPRNLGPSNSPGKNNFVITFKACEGEYIALLEGDDYWTDPNKLQKQVDFLDANPDFSICSHNVIIKDEGGMQPDREKPFTKYKEVITLEDLLRGGGGECQATCSLVFRNRVFGDIPEWFYTIKGSGDWSLQILCASHGKMRSFREPMGVYRANHPANWRSTQMRNAVGRGEEPIGILHRNRLETIDAIDKHFQYRYTSLLQNQRISCYYNLVLEYHGHERLNSAKRLYALKILKEIHKRPPCLSLQCIRTLLLIFLPRPFVQFLSFVKSIMLGARKLS